MAEQATSEEQVLKEPTDQLNVDTRYCLEPLNAYIKGGIWPFCSVIFLHIRSGQMSIFYNHWLQLFLGAFLFKSPAYTGQWIKFLGVGIAASLILLRFIIYIHNLSIEKI